MEFVGLFTAVLALIIIGWIIAIRRRQRRLDDTVTVEHLAIGSTALGNERTLTIFLPPDYYTDDERTYPVLYVNDGQDMDDLRMQNTLARLQLTGQIRPLLVVAIPTNEDRLHEYGTAVALNAQGLGSRAAAYTQFIIDELLPRIAETYRVTNDPAQTGFMGMSLGGLSAFDIVWQHPEQFGMVGVMSGSFWWRSAADSAVLPPHTLIAHELVRRGKMKRPFRAWFQAATLDEVHDRDNDGVIDAIQDTLELMDELETLGYRRGEDMVYVQVLGGRHQHDTWANVLPTFLQWAYGADWVDLIE